MQIERERTANAVSRGCRSVRYRRETCRVRDRERERESSAKAGSRGCRRVRYRREACREREQQMQARAAAEALDIEEKRAE